MHATSTKKQQLLGQLFSALRKQYDPPEPEKRPVLEQLLYALCREGATRDRADRAFRNLQERFFDWNEVRVSSPAEVEDALEELPDPHAKAERIIGLLQEVFETTFAFDLEASENIDKKGLKGAAKFLGKFQSADDYAVSYVVQQTLGGHAIPVDAPTLRVVRRLGLVDSDTTGHEAVRTSLEHLVPKAKGSLFNELISLLGRDVCWEDVPNCPECPLRDECPTGQERLRAGAQSESRGGRLKPR
jgi:endonuclease-3